MTVYTKLLGMPHDKNRELIQVGDKVLVPCTVTSVQEGEEYCNVTIVTDEPMYPTAAGTTITFNARQVVLVKP